MGSVVKAVAKVAASIGMAIGGPELGAVFGNFFLTGFDPISIIGSIALNAIASSLFGKPKAPSAPTSSGGFVAAARARTQIIRSSIQPGRLVYGETMVSGPLAFAESTGDEKEFLHLVVPLASHEVEAIESVYLNDSEIKSGDLDASGNVTAGTYDGKVRIKKHLGADDQAADADLVSEVEDWTSDHRLRGISYLYARLEHDRDVFATGIPNIKAVIKGKKVYDPRTSTTSPTTTSRSPPSGRTSSIVGVGM